mgnify:FL=1
MTPFRKEALAVHESCLSVAGGGVSQSKGFPAPVTSHFVPDVAGGLGVILRRAGKSPTALCSALRLAGGAR